MRKQLKSKISHVCCMCGRLIEPGTEYIFEKYKDNDGLHYQIAQHIHCDAIVEAWKETFARGCDYDSLIVMDDIANNICDPNCPEETVKRCKAYRRMFTCGKVMSEILSPIALNAAIDSIKEGGFSIYGYDE